MHSGKKAANSFGELGPKREVVLNGFKGPESDFGGSKISCRKELCIVVLRFLTGLLALWSMVTNPQQLN